MDLEGAGRQEVCLGREGVLGGGDGEHVGQWVEEDVANDDQRVEVEGKGRGGKGRRRRSDKRRQLL